MLSDTAYFINSFYVRLLGLEDGLVSSSKPKLIFLHGLLGNGQNWIPIARALEEKFTILLIDQRGHGKAKPVSGDFRPEDFSNDLLGVVDELGWDKFSLVGHSLGARTAFYFASHYPERLEKVIFEDMGPHKTGAASEKTDVMINFVPVPFAGRAEAKEFFQDKFEPRYGKVLSDYLYSNLSKQDSGMDWRFNKEGALRCIEIGKTIDFWSEFTSVSVPSLIIRGEKSEHLPLEVYKEMLERNSNSAGVEIPGAGHWVHFDRFGDFVTQVDKFLSE